jgi:hypothetical protein
MGISEVCSPVTIRGSKVASGQPLSPGAKSNPSRDDVTAAHSVPSQPLRRSSIHQEETPASLQVVGPED